MIYYVVWSDPQHTFHYERIDYYGYFEEAFPSGIQVQEVRYQQFRCNPDRLHRYVRDCRRADVDRRIPDRYPGAGCFGCHRTENFGRCCPSVYRDWYRSLHSLLRGNYRII